MPRARRSKPPLAALKLHASIADAPLVGEGAVTPALTEALIDDDHVLINTEVHRAKYKAISANPNVTVTIWVAGPLWRSPIATA